MFSSLLALALSLGACDKVGAATIRHPGSGGAFLTLPISTDVTQGAITVKVTASSVTCIVTGMIIKDPDSLPTLYPARCSHTGTDWQLDWPLDSMGLGGVDIGSGQILRIDIFDALSMPSAYDYTINVVAASMLPSPKSAPQKLAMAMIASTPAAATSATKAIDIQEPKDNGIPYVIAHGGTLVASGDNSKNQLPMVAYLLRQDNPKDPKCHILGGKTTSRKTDAQWRVELPPDQKAGEHVTYWLVVRSAVKDDRTYKMFKVTVHGTP